MKNESFTTTAARGLESVNLPNGLTYQPQSDVNGRNTGRLLYSGNELLFGEYLSYRKAGSRATGQIASARYGKLVGDAAPGIGQTYVLGETLKYAYDQNGNITHIRENGTIVARYAYDTLGRLIREDNRKLLTTTLYDYDQSGNILSKRTAAFSLSIFAEHMTEFKDELYYGYAADQPDRLVYLAGGDLQTPRIYTYDAFGNPKNYGGNTLDWQNGRQLKKFGDVEFAYDGYGKRTSKKFPFACEGVDAQADGVVVYTYDIAGKLIRQTMGNPVTDTLEFIYDQSGLCGVTHKTVGDAAPGIPQSQTDYLYRKNIQGDITHIYTLDGTLQACYTYDAWGNHVVYGTGDNGEWIVDSDGKRIDIGGDPAYATHIGVANPFRYRSYYWDCETGWYFLKTRYYDPAVGRFINADAVEYLDPEAVNGLNLYAYCGNNPVMRVDPEGNSWWEWLLGGVLIVATAISAIVSIVTLGATSPLTAFLGALAVSTFVGATTSMVFNGLELQTDGSLSWNWDSAANGFLWGSISGFANSVLATNPISGLLFGTILNFVKQGLTNHGDLDLTELILSGIMGGLGGCFGGAPILKGLVLGAGVNVMEELISLVLGEDSWGIFGRRYVTPKNKK